MEHLSTGEPTWDVVFDERGNLTAPDRGVFLDEIATAVDHDGLADLFLFSHGWGTSEQGARGLYATMFPLIREAAMTEPRLASVGFAGIYWPSLWFPDSPAAPSQPGGSTQAGGGAVIDDSSGAAALSGAEIAESLMPGFADSGQRDTMARIGRLIDGGEAGEVTDGPTESDEVKERRLQILSQLIASLVPPAPSDGEFEDQGETNLLLTDDPRTDYQAVAEVFGSAPPASSTQGIDDWFGKAINGAKDAVRVLSYTVMKARAGDIGRSGVGPLLARLHGLRPELRVHLIGHSFGARLVSFALSGVGQPSDSPIASLVLLQGAFSHWSFAHAQDNPFGEPGTLNASADRVHGPLVATFSPFDWAVCRWYPKASFLAQQSTDAVQADRWGGMGSDGFQAVEPATDLLLADNGDLNHELRPEGFCRVGAAAVINDVRAGPFAGAHSDIRKPAIARLLVSAAAARP